MTHNSPAVEELNPQNLTNRPGQAQDFTIDYSAVIDSYEGSPTLGLNSRGATSPNNLTAAILPASLMSNTIYVQNESAEFVPQKKANLRKNLHSKWGKSSEN